MDGTLDLQDQFVGLQGLLGSLIRVGAIVEPVGFGNLGPAGLKSEALYYTLNKIILQLEEWRCGFEIESPVHMNGKRDVICTSKNDIVEIWNDTRHLQEQLFGRLLDLWSTISWSWNYFYVPWEDRQKWGTIGQCGTSDVLLGSVFFVDIIHRMTVLKEHANLLGI